MKKMSLEEMVQKIDDSKKVNPLDLSSDQDLSIALMNLVSLEEHFFFSGAKTKQPGFYDLHLLAASMRLYEVGTKAIGAGNKKDAYKMFEKAYELYSLFWGLNMKMIDLAGVKKMEPELYTAAIDKDAKKEKDVKKQMSESRSTVQKLGDWVKNAVNCCIE